MPFFVYSVVGIQLVTKTLDLFVVADKSFSSHSVRISSSSGVFIVIAIAPTIANNRIIATKINQGA